MVSDNGAGEGRWARFKRRDSHGLHARAPCRKPPSQKDVQEALDGYSFSYKWDRKSHYALDIILSF